jgi:hypothetical protein
MNRLTMIIVAVVFAAAGAALYVWNSQRAPTPPQPAAPVAAAPAEPSPPVEPSIKHPIDALTPETPAAEPLPALAQADARVRAALVDLLGRESVQTFLQIDDFVRHVVATVDNLGRSHAAPRLWPVNPMLGRFSVAQIGDGTLPAPGNAERYATFVAFIEGIDTKRALALYKRGYPLFQQAYEELGYPGRYFNDRLVEVIDQLIATPVPTAPLELKLTEVKGPIPSTSPWVRYEFADPALEALPAGQKMMLRVGPAQQQRLRAKLLEVRGQLGKPTASR